MDGHYSRYVRGDLVSLIKEDAKQESEGEDAAKPKSRRNHPKVRIITTIVTCIMLNIVWMFAIEVPSSNEVMDHHTSIKSSHPLKVPSLLELEHDVPIVVICDFKPKNESSINAWIEISLNHGNSEDTLLWEGNTTDTCSNIELSLQPGNYNFQTKIYPNKNSNEEILSDKPITGELTLNMYIWKPLEIEGYIILNGLGFILMISEGAIRNWMKKRKVARSKNLPLHKQRQREEWEQVMQSMSGGEAVVIDDLQVHQQDDAVNESMELQRKRMREQFAAQTESADNDTDEFTDDAQAILDKELGEGTTEGLEGALQKDESIQTVGDIWKQLSEEDNKKKK